jgi:flagellar biogenesis protein FliO
MAEMIVEVRAKLEKFKEDLRQGLKGIGKIDLGMDKFTTGVRSGILGGAEGSGIGKMVGSLGLILGVLGVISDGIKKMVNKLAESSPYLKGVLDIFGRAEMYFYKPFGDFLAVQLRPLAMWLLKMAVDWVKFSRTLAGQSILGFILEPGWLLKKIEELLGSPLNPGWLPEKLAEMLGTPITNFGDWLKGFISEGIPDFGKWITGFITGTIPDFIKWISGFITGSIPNFAIWLSSFITGTISDFGSWIGHLMGLDVAWNLKDAIWDWFTGGKTTGGGSGGGGSSGAGSSGAGGTLNAIQGAAISNLINQGLSYAQAYAKVVSPFYQLGSRYVPITGLAMVHRGEQILRANETTVNKGTSVYMNFSFAGARFERGVDVEDAINKATRTAELELRRQGLS